MKRSEAASKRERAAVIEYDGRLSSDFLTLGMPWSCVASERHNLLLLFALTVGRRGDMGGVIKVR